MSLRDTFFNLLGADVQTNNIEAQKTSNQFLRSSRDFLKYGNREQLTPEWAEIRMSDKDMYRGYSYAVIQKRGNKVASLAKNNLSTWAKPEVIDEFQANEETVQHPYLKLIEDSTKFTEKQFWKNISIYLDLAGRYYLGAVRNQIQPLKEGFPVINTDITEFVMLNPYEIRRVINKDGVLAGYIERKKDGRYREWPVHQIIEMKELNPFDPDNSQWAITDAAKEAVYTLNQSGDYTRQSLSGNIDAPGIITTDLILNDEDFANFRSRVQQHKKGEPLFGNGAGSIKWDSMQIDLDKAALLDINEINRTMLFAVSGTSKTSLGIEQSGTTRETARVQSEQFVSDTAQPRLEDIVDFLNLDYRKHYKREYKNTGYMIEVNSAVSRDYSVEVQATEMRQAQIDLAMRLMQSGYTMESSYQYAQGEIELGDLELEKGKDKPTPPDDMGGQDGGPDTPETPNDPQIPQVEKTEESTTPSADLDPNSELTPNADIQENSGEGEQSDPLESLEVECNHEGECSCCEHDPKIDTYVNRLTTEDNEVLLKAYNDLLKDIRVIQKKAINDAIDKVEINSFQESDIITEEQKETLIEKLTNAFKKYWWLLMPLFGNNLTKQRNKEFGEDKNFTFTNELQNKVQLNASEVAKGHTETILRDILDSSNRAYTNVLESAAADLIVEEYKKNPSKFESYFKQQPTVAQATKAIQNTDILETNRKIYDKANKMALDGFKRADIVKAIREEYNHLSTTRAETIARNETSRAFTQSQYQADYQFLKSINKLDKAYKHLYSRSGNPCKYCQSLINKGPIPFTANFLDKGEEISIVENGKTSTFKADYENITAGVVHVNCQCEYRLVFKGEDGRITDVYNSLRGEDNSNLLNDYSDWLLVHSNDSESRKALNGGAGSGNHGHSGRPGQRGGSGNGQASSLEIGIFDNPLDSGDNYWRPLSDVQLDSTQTYSEYYDKEKGLRTQVVEINPKDYLTLLQKGGHSTGMTHQQIIDEKPDSIEFHRKLIQEKKPIATPTIGLNKDGIVDAQEGRHRLEAATLEGITKVPVMISYSRLGKSPQELLSGVEHKDITDKYRKLVTEQHKKIETDNSIQVKNGGHGSGNFGHSGRLGQRGGSGKGSGSVSTLDNTGRELTQEQQDYFRDSKIRDEKGNLLTVYHGSPATDIDEFNTDIAGKNTRSGEKGIFFTDNKKTADEFSYERIPTDSIFVDQKGKKGKVYEGYVNITNPLDLGKTSPEKLWEFASSLGQLDGKEKFIKNVKEFQKIGNEQLIKTNIDLSKVSKSKYDGIIAKMDVKGNDREYIVFQSSQFKTSDNLKPTKSKKINNGGHGSGNFGHAGRPGQRGGSGNNPSMKSEEITSGEELFNTNLDNKVEAFQKLSTEEQAVFCKKALEIPYSDMPDDLAKSEFQKISYALGIKEKPKTMTEAEFQQRLEQGETPYFRAVHGNSNLTSEDIAKHLYNSEYTYQGSGSDCDGTYMTSSWQTMKSYLETRKDAVSRIFIDNTAKIYNQGDGESLKSEIKDTMSFLQKETKMHDNTAMAVSLIAHKYDGYRFKDYDGREYTCMLNRNKLTLNMSNFSQEKPNFKGDPDVE